MQSIPTESIPLACVPGAIPADERPAHFDLIQRLFGTEVQERESLPDGYAFRFAREAFEDLARFVSNERRCCPFLAFDLAVYGSDSPVWLRLSGPEGTRAFLEAKLPIK